MEEEQLEPTDLLSPAAFLFSSPVKATAPPSPSPCGDCKQFQDLRRIVDALQIPLEKVQDTTCKLLDILQSAALARWHLQSTRPS